MEAFKPEGVKAIKRNYNFWSKVVLILVVALLLLVAPISSEAYTVLGENVQTEPVAAGVTLQKIFQNTNEGPLKIYVLTIDLGNPFVKLDVLIGEDNKSFSKASHVLDKGLRSGAVAAINGDFFHMAEGKHPLGFTMRDGQLLTSPMLRNNFYSFALSKSLTPFIELFNFEGSVEVFSQGEDVEQPIAIFPLSGINKPRYSLAIDGTVYVSDRDSLQLYDSTWGEVSRGAQKDLPGWVEVLVDQGVVQEVRVDQPGVPIPSTGFVLAGHGQAAQFLLQNCLPGSRVRVNYRVEPDGDSIQTAVGGKNLLVVNGQPYGEYSKELEGRFARSAAAYSRDGKTVYLVAVEGSKESRGMYQSELASFLVDRLGVWKALNLDGGGSTTLAVRPLGEEKPVLVNKPSQGSQRAVPTALAVFSTAPPGKLKGLILQGPQEVLAGLSYSFDVKGYDEYFNPYTIVKSGVNWSVIEGEASIKEGKFRASEGGTCIIEAAYEGVRQQRQVRVLGTKDFASLDVTPSEIKINPGEKVALSVNVQGKDGRTWNLPYGEVSWEIEGDVGTVEKGVFAASSKDASGKIRVRFLGLIREVPVTVGNPLPQDVRDHWSATAVKELISRGIVKGYPDGTFRPDRPVTRAEFVTILAKAFGWQVNGEVSLPFKDSIPQWALPSLKAAWSRGVAGGYPDGTFKPDRFISRAELAVLIDRALGLSSGGAAVAFLDAGQIPFWARDSVQRAAGAGIMQGSGGMFRPGAMATRGEVAALIYRSLLYAAD